MKKGIIYALITAIMFVTLEPVSKLIAEDVSPYAITFWRFLIGSVMLLPVAASKIKREKIHITAKDFDNFYFSAGKIGYQIETGLEELRKVIPFELDDIAE